MKAFTGALLLAAVLAVLGDAPGEGADVVTVTDANFREMVIENEGLVLVEFYAPWCGHCKTLASEWAKAATALKGKVTIAAMDATASTEFPKMFNVNGFPTILSFPVGKKEDEEGIIFGQYPGSRDADGVVNFATEELSKAGIDITEVDEIVDQESFDRCTSKKYCLIFTLPHVLDSGAEGRKKYIATIKELVSSLGRSNPSGVAWVQTGNQEALESQLQVAAFPGMLIINKDRSRYLNHIGAFSASAMSKTVRSLQTGRVTANAFKSLPAIETTHPWDGKDYVPPADDED